MKGLIFGTLYLRDREALDFMAKWRRAQECVNPGWPLLLVDAGSYKRLSTGHDALSDFEFVQIGERIEQGIRLNAPGTLVSFSNNVGHLARDGQDGWGRAFCQGLQIAIDNDFDYVAHVEGDLLSAVGWQRGIDLLERNGKAVLAVLDSGYQMLETALMLFYTPWIGESDFIARYAWETRKSSDIPENEVELLCREQLMWVNINGCRNDADLVRPQDVDKMLYITHCRDARLYDRFMKRFDERDIDSRNGASPAG